MRVLARQPASTMLISPLLLHVSPTSPSSSSSLSLSFRPISLSSLESPPSSSPSPIFNVQDQHDDERDASIVDASTVAAVEPAAVATPTASTIESSTTLSIPSMSQSSSTFASMLTSSSSSSSDDEMQKKILARKKKKEEQQAAAQAKESAETTSLAASLESSLSSLDAVVVLDPTPVSVAALPSRPPTPPASSPSPPPSIAAVPDSIVADDITSSSLSSSIAIDSSTVVVSNSIIIIADDDLSLKSIATIVASSSVSLPSPDLSSTTMRESHDEIRVDNHIASFRNIDDTIESSPIITLTNDVASSLVHSSLIVNRRHSHDRLVTANEYNIATNIIDAAVATTMIDHTIIVDDHSTITNHNDNNPTASSSSSSNDTDTIADVNIIDSAVAVYDRVQRIESIERRRQDTIVNDVAVVDNIKPVIIDYQPSSASVPIVDDHVDTTSIVASIIAIAADTAPIIDLHDRATDASSSSSTIKSDDIHPIVSAPTVKVDSNADRINPAVAVTIAATANVEIKSSILSSSLSRVPSIHNDKSDTIVSLPSRAASSATSSSRSSATHYSSSLLMLRSIVPTPPSSSSSSSHTRTPYDESIVQPMTTSTIIASSTPLPLSVPSSTSSSAISSLTRSIAPSMPSSSSSTASSSIIDDSPPMRALPTAVLLPNAPIDTATLISSPVTSIMTTPATISHHFNAHPPSTSAPSTSSVSSSSNSRRSSFHAYIPSSTPIIASTHSFVSPSIPAPSVAPPSLVPHSSSSYFAATPHLAAAPILSSAPDASAIPLWLESEREVQSQLMQLQMSHTANLEAAMAKQTAFIENMMKMQQSHIDAEKESKKQEEAKSSVDMAHSSALSAPIPPIAFHPPAIAAPSSSPPISSHTAPTPSSVVVHPTRLVHYSRPSSSSLSSRSESKEPTTIVDEYDDEDAYDDEDDNVEERPTNQAVTNKVVVVDDDDDQYDESAFDSIVPYGLSRSTSASVIDESIHSARPSHLSHPVVAVRTQASFHRLPHPPAQPPKSHLPSTYLNAAQPSQPRLHSAQPVLVHVAQSKHSADRPRAIPTITSLHPAPAAASLPVKRESATAIATSVYYAALAADAADAESPSSDQSAAILAAALASRSSTSTHAVATHSDTATIVHPVAAASAVHSTSTHSTPSITPPKASSPPPSTLPYKSSASLTIIDQNGTILLGARPSLPIASSSIPAAPAAHRVAQPHRRVRPASASARSQARDVYAAQHHLSASRSVRTLRSSAAAAAPAPSIVTAIVQPAAASVHRERTFLPEPTVLQRQFESVRHQFEARQLADAAGKDESKDANAADDHSMPITNNHHRRAPVISQSDTDSDATAYQPSLPPSRINRSSSSKSTSSSTSASSSSSSASAPSSSSASASTVVAPISRANKYKARLQIAEAKLADIAEAAASASAAAIENTKSAAETKVKAKSKTVKVRTNEAVKRNQHPLQSVTAIIAYSQMAAMHNQQQHHQYHYQQELYQQELQQQLYYQQQQQYYPSASNYNNSYQSNLSTHPPSVPYPYSSSPYSPSFSSSLPSSPSFSFLPPPSALPSFDYGDDAGDVAAAAATTAYFGSYYAAQQQQQHHQQQQSIANHQQLPASSAIDINKSTLRTTHPRIAISSSSSSSPNNSSSECSFLFQSPISVPHPSPSASPLSTHVSAPHSSSRDRSYIAESYDDNDDTVGRHNRRSRERKVRRARSRSRERPIVSIKHDDDYQHQYNDNHQHRVSIDAYASSTPTSSHDRVSDTYNDRFITNDNARHQYRYPSSTSSQMADAYIQSQQ